MTNQRQATRWLLEALCRRQLPGRWTLLRGHNGQPALQGADGQHWCCSISHCQGLVTVAISRERVGIDCEPQERQFRQPTRMAERILSPAEQHQFQDMAEAERPAWLMRRWTLKEAALKALGTGIAGGLERVAFRGDPECPELLRDDCSDRSWQTLSTVIRPGFWLAMAWQGGPSPVLLDATNWD